MICARQASYYAALALADQVGEATPFVEFMLQALQQALREASESEPESAMKPRDPDAADPATVQVTVQVTAPIARLLAVLTPGTTLRASELMQRLGLAHRPTFNQNYLKPALAAGLIEMTDPASPRSPLQQYRRV